MEEAAVIATEQQTAAIMTDHEKVVVLGGPGSMKTRTIVARVKRLIATSAARPSGIAVVTYTNAAARVIVDRLPEHSFGEVPGEPMSDHVCDICGALDPDETCRPVRLGFVGTLHAFCLRHLNEHGGWPSGIRVLDDDEADELLERSARDSGVRTTPTVMRVLKQTRRDWLTERLMPETAPRIAVRAYYAEMISRGELDYNTVLTQAFKSLADREKPRTAWSDLIVDEYQDASPLDARIYQNATARRRFFVGDPMQAIFGFRGGDVRELLRLGLLPDWELHRLAENFRSAPAVCRAASSLARHAYAGPTISATGSEDVPVDASSRGFQNAATEALAIAQAIASEAGEEDGFRQDGSEWGDDGPGKWITVAEFNERFAGNEMEAVCVGNWIRSTRVSPAGASRWAVLARTNGIADQVAATLEAQGVPVRRIHAADRPSDWRLAMAALDLLARPSNLAAIRRYMAAPAAAWTKDYFATEAVTGDADKMAAELVRLGVSAESVALITLRFDELPKTATLDDLHASLMLDGSIRTMAGDGCFVGTIHSAKGMEFDTVVLAGFEDEVIPGERKAADVEEERRVAYVGMTRAKRRLIVTWSKFRQPVWRKGFEQHRPSRFVAEAGLEDMKVTAPVWTLSYCCEDNAAGRECAH